MSDPCCDFCSSPDVRWSYPARDFEHNRELMAFGLMQSGRWESQAIDLTVGSSGAWAACPVCHALIQRGDRERLVRRAAKKMLKLHPIPMPLANAIKLIRPLQDQFWSQREGAPTPVEREAPHARP